jgi:hypothetical protein
MKLRLIGSGGHETLENHLDTLNRWANLDLSSMLLYPADEILL